MRRWDMGLGLVIVKDSFMKGCLDNSPVSFWNETRPSNRVANRGAIATLVPHNLNAALQHVRQARSHGQQDCGVVEQWF